MEKRENMPSVAIVTDTDASLSPDIAARYGIHLVPINIHFGQETFKTSVDMDDAALFARVDREGKLPTTSAPTPGQFVEAYKDAFESTTSAVADAASVVCICVSSEISGTYNAALSACELLPERDITVVDSRTLSVGQGFMALAAAEAARAGASKEEVIARALDVRSRTYLYASLSTLKYLAMSGRVGYLAAGMAGLLNIKPVLTVRDGRLDLLEKVRTRRKSWARVFALVARDLDGRAIERMAIVHADAEAEAREFEAQLRDSLPPSASCPPSEDVMMAEFTAGLSVHAGAGLVGVAVVAGQ
jgi:DegV family protein with EDD domain